MNKSVINTNKTLNILKEKINKINVEKNSEVKENNSLIRNIEWDKENQKVTITFGKNGLGLTTEFAEISKFIERMSKTAYVYIEDTFIDSLDDVYDIVLKYHYK